jgi:transposase
MAPGRRLNIGEALSEHSPRLDSTTANLGGECSERSENKMQEAGSRESSGRRGQLEGLPVIRPDVAGIDLGSERHWVCAPTVEGVGREREDFGATTPELIRMGQWLKERRVASVAMESTGVYWIAPHEVLEAEGFEILLVDTRQLARVPGRDKKTDATDCEWIQRLHSCGLLRGSFRPREDICMLRTLVRDKANLVAESGDWVRRMQKSLDQMNVRVHRAVSNIDGVTGMAILRAIAQGERDPRQLAKLRDPRCRHSEEEIAEQLSGHWREDHLFSLRQFLQMYDAIQQRIADYDQEILRKLAAMQRDGYREQPPPTVKNPQKAKAIKKRGEEPMREALYRMSGADLTSIDAIGVETVQVLLSEYGPDLSRFPTEKHFVSHITLAPHRPMSGGKPVRKKRRNTASTRVAAALRMAALSLRHSQTALGAYYRKIARRIGGDVAVFATARKLATLIYRVLRWGQPYVDEGAEAYEKRYQEIRITALQLKAQELGYHLLPSLAAQGRREVTG